MGDNQSQNAPAGSTNDTTESSVSDGSLPANTPQASSRSLVPPMPPAGGFRKFLSKRSFLGIMGILVLLGSIAAGVILVQIRQRLAQKAALPNLCGNLDIMLVLDRSWTMTQKEADGRMKLEWAKDAARAFVQEIADSNKNGSVRIGVSSFGLQGNDGSGILDSSWNSTLVSGLSTDYSSVKDAINGIQYVHFGSCDECGIRIANKELADKKLANVPQVVILLADGEMSYTWSGEEVGDSPRRAIEEANKGRSQGITYYSIGYGEYDREHQRRLTAIAGDPSRYFFKPTVQEFSGAFVDLAHLLCPAPTATPSQSAEATAAPTEVASVAPSATSLASSLPSESPTVSPSATPTLEVAASPTETPAQLVAQVVSTSTPTPTPSPTATAVSTNATPATTATPAPQLALASPVPNPTATPAPKLPEAGVSLPTYLAIIFGLSIFLWSSVLAFQHYQD